ncbi:MAG TPA: Spx/MgsR family RNA polymerase-binding regulatory protein [Chitinophagaceae bacterium]|nr:Spx/MgsR family RNA polymerase-binding regulatory protein [Chitinophagaceae bacterium]
MYIIYGLPYCDATKLAMEWFNERRLVFTLHDYKIQGITPAELNRWCNQVGWETIMNKRSTTWRSLDAGTQAEITNQAAAVEAMVKHTSLIKRPVIELNNKVLAVGYNERNYESAFC